MRLLFVSQYIYRPDQAAANRIYDFLQRLARRGHEPVAVAGGVHYLEDRIDPELAKKRLVETRWGDVRVIQTYAAANFRKSVGSRLRSYLTFAWYGMRAAWRAGPVDAVMVSIQPIFVAPLAWIVSRLRGAPFILEVRDLWPEAAAEVGLIRSGVLLRLGHWLADFVYRRAKHIIVIGPEMKRVLVRKGLPPEKIDVFPQGYQPPDREPKTRDAMRRELGLGDEFVLMFAGSFGLANNDVPLIVEAAAKLVNEPDFVVLMIGEGDQRPACEERCRREGLDNVRFLPMVSKQEVHSLLAAADACVMALPPGDFWKICLQNKIFDYLGNGRPVVAAVAGDQADLLREADAGLVVDVGDADALAAAVLRLKRDPELARRLGENARRYVRENLMREQILDRYVQVLEGIVEGEASPGNLAHGDT